MLEPVKSAQIPEGLDAYTTRRLPGRSAARRFDDDDDFASRSLSWGAWRRHPLSSTRRPARSGSDFQYQLGLYRLRKKEYQRAAEAFRAYLERSPEATRRRETLHWLGESLFHLGDWDAAAETYERLLAREPGPRSGANALLTLGWIFQRRGEDERSLEAYRRYLERFPEGHDAPLAAFRMGEIAFEEGRYKSAADSFQSAAGRSASFSERPAAVFWRGEACCAAGRFPEARLQYARYLRLLPAGPLADDALFGTGWSHLKEGDYLLAGARFDELIRKHPRSPLTDESLYLLGWARYLGGRLDEASDAFHALSQHYPDSPWRGAALFREGITLFSRGRYEASEAVFRNLLETPETSTEGDRPAYMLALSLLGEGRCDEAESLMASPAGDETTGGTRTVMLSLGWCRYRSGAFEEAEAAFREVQRRFPASPDTSETWFWVAESQMRQEKFAQATLTYRKAGAVPGQEHRGDDALMGAAWSYFLQGRWEAAASEVDDLRERYPGTPFITKSSFVKGESLYRLGRYREALDEILQVTQAGPGSPDRPRALLLAGKAFQKLEAYEDGAFYFERFLDEFPASAGADDARFQLAWDAYRRGNYESARVRYAAVARLHPESELAPLSLLRAADSSYRLKRFGEAEAAYRAVIAGNPGSTIAVDARYGLSLALLAEGKSGEYEDVAWKLIETGSPAAAPALLQLAGQFAISGRSSEARGLYRRLISGFTRTPEAPRGVLSLSRLLRREGERPEAEEVLRRGIALYGSGAEGPVLRLEYGNLLRGAGDCRAALDEFSEVISAGDAQTAAAGRLGAAQCWWSLGFREKARGAFERLAAGPAAETAAEAVLRWASLELEGGDAESALAALDRAAAPAAGISYLRGRSLASLGKDGEALDSFAAVLAEDPRGRFAASALFESAEVHRRAGDEAAARSMYRRVIDDFGDGHLAAAARKRLVETLPDEEQ